MKPTPSKKCNRAGDKTLTFWFHADSQALVISARLTNVAGLERNHAAAVARTLILETVAFFHTTSEETLHTHTHISLKTQQEEQHHHLYTLLSTTTTDSYHSTFSRTIRFGWHQKDFMWHPMGKWSYVVGCVAQW